MVAGLLVFTFVAGYLVGFLAGERRWKRPAFEALDLLAKAIASLRCDPNQRRD